MINKLKQTDINNVISPIENKINFHTRENSFINDLKDKINNLKNTIKDINVSSVNNIFNSKSATIDGDSVSFNSTNDSLLKEESYKINVSQLAQKDVYQSNKFLNKTDVYSSGSININGTNFDLTNKTLDDLSNDINSSGLNVYSSIEEVSKNEYRLVIKSSSTGLDNKINISENNVDLGFSDPLNNVLKAQNLIMNIDGTEFNLNEPMVKLTNGLEIVAHKLGETTFTIQNNNSEISNVFSNFTNSYNNIIESIDKELYGSASTISDKSTLENLKTNIKNILLETKDNDSIFSKGFSLDKSGKLSFDNSIINNQFNETKDLLSNLFIGTNSNKGIFSKLNDLLDNENTNNGILSNYSKFLSNKIDSLNIDMTNMNEKLDKKYNDLSEKFNQYNSIITSFESSFSSLKLIINSKTN